MSIVEGIGPRPLGSSSTRPRAGQPRFTLDTAAGTARAVAAEASTPAVAAGMLALQELDAESPADKAARRRGRALLAALSRLQLGLLSMSDSEATLDELASLVAGIPYASDPALASALQAITLRVHVELARYRRHADQPFVAGS